MAHTLLLYAWNVRRLTSPDFDWCADVNVVHAHIIRSLTTDSEALSREHPTYFVYIHKDEVDIIKESVKLSELISCTENSILRVGHGPPQELANISSESNIFTAREATLDTDCFKLKHFELEPVNALSVYYHDAV